MQNTVHALSTLWKAEVSEWQITCTSLLKSSVFTWTFPCLQMLTEISMNVFEEDISIFLLRFFWEEQTAEISKNNLTHHSLRQPFCPWSQPVGSCVQNTVPVRERRRIRDNKTNEMRYFNKFIFGIKLYILIRSNKTQQYAGIYWLQIYSTCLGVHRTHHQEYMKL